MDSYLLDTNVAIWACYQGSSRHEEMRRRVGNLGSGNVYVSPISLAEVEYGLHAATMEEENRRRVRDGMAAFPILQLNRHTAKHYGQVRADLFRKYAPRDNRNRFATQYVEDLRERTTGKDLGIQENDLWIVCVAIQYNVVFVTADTGGGMRHIVEVANYTGRTQFWKLCQASRSP